MDPYSRVINAHFDATWPEEFITLPDLSCALQVTLLNCSFSSGLHFVISVHSKWLNRLVGTAQGNIAQMKNYLKLSLLLQLVTEKCTLSNILMMNCFDCLISCWLYKETGHYKFHFFLKVSSFEYFLIIALTFYLIFINQPLSSLITSTFWSPQHPTNRTPPHIAIINSVHLTPACGLNAIICNQCFGWI